MAQLNIQLTYEGQDSDVVLGMYIDMNMTDDISQVGWNLCGCDDARHAIQFGECEVVTSNQKNNKADKVLSISGSDDNLIERAVQEYLDGFEYYIRPVILELFSRTGDRYEFRLKEFSFDTIQSQ